ncbi:MAG TPA: AmmeMemoRadiSam system radical SAM enzyme [Dehalococcoidales bacterium]|nr:AmmeMemoRadiSam system radical SAM enzyme [Dehalococcoidales bacterium]
MREALLYQKLADSRVQCHTCQWLCTINPGKSGVCRMYANQNGSLYNLNYARISAANIDPIEKKPLFHFYPGTMVYSLGGWGCNFHCAGCQNWEISMVDEVMVDSAELSPECAVEKAIKSGCAGIAWTYNEPSVWFEYTLDCAKLAKKKGLYTVYVTNGYLTAEALDTIGPYLDAWRVDVKGFSDALYKNLAKITHWQGILEVAERAKKRWNMHVEVVTNVMPMMNDDDKQLNNIARWINANLGELTPWHITRFHPDYNFPDIPATSLATLEKAYKIGRNAGLKFVYLGNVVGHESENTTCPSCNAAIVQRLGYETKVVGLSGECCQYCRTPLNFRNTAKKGERT